ISSTSDSTIWYSQHDASAGNVCLHSYNYKTRQTKVYYRIPGGETIAKEMTDGKIMLVTIFGIGWLTGDSIQYLYRHPQITYNSSTYSIEEIEPGIVLLATCSGILKFNTNNNKIDTL